jgi:tRNA(Ile)-lysidine synthase
MPLDAETLFKTLKTYNKLVVAVSGGPDSIALLHCIVGWADQQDIEINAATVDHGLREGSAREAKAVETFCSKLGIKHRILTNEDTDKPQSDLQAYARNVRYRLLCDYARQTEADAVVTAHHADDQAETFLLRLARGSGVYGLSAMAPETELYGMPIVRPLLDCGRETLEAYVQTHDLPTVEDPSNRNHNFARVKLRDHRGVLESLGFNRDTLLATTKRMKRVRDMVEFYVSQRFLEVSLDSSGVYILPVDALRAPEEIGLRTLSSLIMEAGQQSYSPRLDGLERLYFELLQSDSKATLHGATIERKNEKIYIWREPGRAGLPIVSRTKETELVWDNRFVLNFGSHVPPCTIKALYFKPDKEFLHKNQYSIPAPAFFSAPGLFIDGALFCLPWNGEGRERGVECHALSRLCKPFHI